MNAIFVSLVIPRLKDDYFANVNMLILDIQGPVLRSCWLPNDGSRFPPLLFKSRQPGGKAIPVPICQLNVELTFYLAPEMLGRWRQWGKLTISQLVFTPPPFQPH